MNDTLADEDAAIVNAASDSMPLAGREQSFRVYIASINTLSRIIVSKNITSAPKDATSADQSKHSRRRCDEKADRSLSVLISDRATYQGWVK